MSVDSLKARLDKLGIAIPHDDLRALLAPAQDLRRRAEALRAEVENVRSA